MQNIPKNLTRFVQKVVAATILFFMITQTAIISVAAPGATIISPAVGSVSVTRMVNITGTAFGSEIQWVQTSKSDFDAGSMTNLTADVDGNLAINRQLYDDFNDNNIDPSRWTVTGSGGIFATETDGQIKFNGTCTGSGAALAMAAPEFVSNWISADFISLSRTETGVKFYLQFFQDGTNAMEIGYDDYGSSQVSLYSRCQISGQDFGEAIGPMTAGPHNLELKLSGGNGYVYIDGSLKKSYSATYLNPLIRFGAHLASYGVGMDARWDNVTVGYCPTAVFSSSIFDTNLLYRVLKMVQWNATTPANTGVTVEIRSGDATDLSDASQWAPITNGQTSNLPAVKRYLQYRVRLTTTNDLVTPVFKDIVLSYTIPVKKVEISTDNQASWIPAVGKEKWYALLSLPEDSTNITVKVTDEWDEVGYSNITVYVDTTPPHGSIQINRGEKYADSNDVTVLLNATDRYGIGSVMLSENPDLDGANWETYHSMLLRKLSAGDGTKTLYAKFRDVNGLESEVVNASIIVDTDYPSGSVVLNSDAEFTNDVNVSLLLNASDGTGAIDMLISNKMDFEGAVWTSYNSSLCWTLLPGNGERKVFVKFRDPIKHESNIYSDAIYLDTQAPLVRIAVNSSAAYLVSPDVTLLLNSTDNYRVDSLEISEDPLFTGADWQEYRTTLSYRFHPGDGTKTLYARARDAAGNIGQSNSTSVILDTTLPISTIGQLPGETDNPNIAVNWSGNDATSGVKWYDLQYRDGSGSWTDWLQHTVLVNSTFIGQQGHNYSFKVRALDNAGNQQVYQDAPGASISVRPYYVPMVSVISPKEAAKVGGAITITGRAYHPDDRRSVLRVQVRVDDGDWVTALGTLDWKYKLDTGKLSDGTHTVHVMAYDGERYSSEQDLNLTVSNVKQGTELPWMFIGIAVVIIAAAAVAGIFVATRRKRSGEQAASPPAPVQQAYQSYQTYHAGPMVPPVPKAMAGPPLMPPSEAQMTVVGKISVEELEKPVPRIEKTTEQKKADEEAMRENRIMKALSSLPRGLPSTLWGTDIEELAAKVAQAESRESPTGDKLVKIDNRWYYGDEVNLGLFMQKYEEK